MRLSWITAATAIALTMSACGGGDAGEETETPETSSSSSASSSTPTVATGSPSEGLPTGPSALRDMSDPAFPEPLVDVAEIRSGGPPPDGIPPLDAPEFIPIDDGDLWLDDRESVVVLEIDGDARAYPVQILIWHEIVNDTVGGIPVAVTYCPLCNSAVSYRRSIDGVETTFGTSGRLFASALVMYDRATESLWTHFDGRAVVGVLTGHELESISSPLMSWGDFKALHPDGVVLDRDATGYVRRYGDNPYVGYDNPDGTPFLFRGTLDDRAAAMQRVVGITLGDEAAAWALEAVASESEPAKATNAELAGTPIVILWRAGQSSALDSQDIELGTDVGSVAVLIAEVDGRRLNFSAQPDGTFTDDETGSTWDMAGRAVDGELDGSQLERVVHLDTFWFAWATYRPGTDLAGS